MHFGINALRFVNVVLYSFAFKWTINSKNYFYFLARKFVENSKNRCNFLYVSTFLSSLISNNFDNDF